jgi:hypothetical protein
MCIWEAEASKEASWVQGKSCRYTTFHVLLTCLFTDFLCSW